MRCMKDKIRKCFTEVYGHEDCVKTYFSPGRVNLIGEHTDYNGGHVFPCALTIGTYAAVRFRDDRKLNFYSQNFVDSGVIEASLDNIKYNEELQWAVYPMGIIWSFIQKGYDISKGFDICICGNIPNGSGLSSSASIEVLTATILNDEFEFGLSRSDIAQLSRYSECEYNKVSCGIMDQFAIAMGKKDCAIFLDTNNLEYEYVPIKLPDKKLVIACSNKKRKLTDSKYNERFNECRRALETIRAVKDIGSLGELTEADFERLKGAIEDPILVKRAKHAVYENQRTIKAVEALREDNIALFGKLMNESHISLRDDYEVTGAELDTLVEAAWNTKGTVGARMTGAGFGGCTVNVVEQEYVDSFVERVSGIYLDKIGYRADFYVVDIGCGTTAI